jgi:hypothetical protein
MSDPPPTNPRRRRGRPPLDERDPSISLHVRVPVKQFDAIYARSRAERVSIADWVRRRLWVDLAGSLKTRKEPG